MSESAQTPMKGAVRDAMGEQIKHELYAAYLYLSMAGSFEVALEHEKEVTGRINDLYELSVRENDYPAQVFLNWFVTEQVEEEKSATDIVERLRMAGEDNAALLLLDSELGGR